LVNVVQLYIVGGEFIRRHGSRENDRQVWPYDPVR
jgi:hypothetical protein